MLTQINELKFRMRGLSYWAARFKARGDVYEFDCDWTDLPRQGLREVRLHCPDGQVAVLGNSVDLSDRAFQFKTAGLLVGVGKQLLAHTIGILTGPNGEATTYTWDYVKRALVGPTQEILNQDGSLSSAGPMGRLHFDLLGAKIS